jgi:hypothetical protein
LATEKRPPHAEKLLSRWVRVSNAAASVHHQDGTWQGRQDGVGVRCRGTYGRRDGR